MRKLLFPAILAACAAPELVLGQALEFTYGYRVPPATGLTTVLANGTIQAGNVDVGKTLQISFVAENRGPTPWTISRASIAGGPYVVTPSGSQLVNPNSSGVYSITFSPTVAGVASSRLTLDFTNDRGANLQIVFFLEGTGVAPDFITSYVLPNGNQTPIAAGDALPFPSTVAGSTVAATFVVTNRGTGPGTVNTVTLAGGDAFTISGLPLLPRRLEPNGTLQFTINFAPPARDSYQANLRVELEGSPARTFRITGQGASAVFSYEWSTTGVAPAVVAAGGTLTLPEVAIGTAQQVNFVVRNTGNTPGTINGIALTGTGFALNPINLPARLAAGDALQFSFSFTARDATPVQGQLRVEGVNFNVIGTGLGARLTYTARINNSDTTVPAGGTYTFPNTQVGLKSTMVTMIVRNEGNQPANVAGVTTTPNVFAIPTAPQLPSRLNPGQTLQIPLQFSPQALGLVTGQLVVDDAVINLRGIGDNPPALPGVTFTGAAAAVNALDQPSVGLTLDAAYPADLVGTLTISFSSTTFADDPSIQFASGGRRVDFRIPAGTRTALFGQAQNTLFQVGTVAGDIIVTANFTVGSVALTVQNPPARTFTLAAAGPVIRSVRIGSQTATSFEVLVTGYATTRQMSQLNLQFASASGGNLQTTSLDANVEGQFTAFYQTADSRNFGSQFTATVTVNVSGEISAVQSVSVRATNARGTSSTVTTNLR